MKIFISTSNQTYSRTAVYYSEIKDKKEFVSLPQSWPAIIFQILRIRKCWNRKSKLVVGSPSHLAVPLLRILTPNVIYFDAGWPLSDATSNTFLKYISTCRTFIIDFLAFQCAHHVIVESVEQRDDVIRKFSIPRRKLSVIYTGFNEDDYHNARSSPKRPIELDKEIFDAKDIVLFRGKSNPEAGIEKIVEAAKLISPKAILVIATNRQVDLPRITNLVLIDRKLSKSEIVWLYLNSKIVLGQMGSNSRLQKTIPHKFFEAGAFAKCYVTPMHIPISRICKADEVVFIEDSTPEAIAKSVQEILSTGDSTIRFGEKLGKLYLDNFSQKHLGIQFEQILDSTDIWDSDTK